MTRNEMQRKTTQRKVILEELCKVTSHPTAVELYEIVRGQLPRISLGTVYRNLDLLSKNGTIQKLTLGGSEARFDSNAAPHCHVRCEDCGRVDDVHDLPTEFIRDVPDRAAGYEILGYRLEFFGLCPACRDNGKAENRNRADTLRT